MSKKTKKFTIIETPTIIGQALAGHYLMADYGNPDGAHEKRYSNVLTDYVTLVIAEVKSRGPIDPDTLTRKRREREAAWLARMEQSETKP